MSEPGGSAGAGRWRRREYVDVSLTRSAHIVTEHRMCLITEHFVATHASDRLAEAAQVRQLDSLTGDLPRRWPAISTLRARRPAQLAAQ